MRVRDLFVVAAMALLGPAVSAGGGMFDLAFNNETFDVWGAFRLGKDDQGLLLGGRYLYESDRESKYPALLLGYAAKPTANDEISFSLGLQVVAGETQEVDTEGVAFGGSGEWTPADWKGVFLGARVYYAPEVFCFSDTEGLFEYAGRGGYKINERMVTFLEYSAVKADVVDIGSLTVASGLKIGFGLRF